MQQAVLSILLSGLGRDALKVAAGLLLAIVIALAFAIASVAAFFGAVLGYPVTGANLTAGAPSAQVADLSRAQIGVPYVWGGASPAGFDCSGLVQWVYGQVGVSLPRTAQQQFVATARLTPDQLQPDDLIFFAATYPSSEWITHVGIYVGGGRMINAPAEGDVVREMDAFTGFWGAHYAGAGRVAGR